MSNQTQTDGGPAFPRPASEYEPNEMRTDGRIAAVPYNGMSLRDYFASAALRGELAAQVPADPQSMPSDEYVKLMAGRAYTFADAMLAARNGGAK